MELIKWIENENLLMPFGGRWNPSDDIIKKVTELLEKEKRALMEAHHNGQINEHESAFDYFTKTFTDESK